MRLPISLLAVAATSASSGWAEEPARQMNVRQGPDSVFAEPPGQIFPELVGATATNENGRIGNELVFWGYRLADGRDVFLVGCAIADNVDCGAREARVCQTDTQVMARGTSEGLVRELSCKSIATAGPGDIRPGCIDRERAQSLHVSLVTCL
jgi:hypothetical protein